MKETLTIRTTPSTVVLLSNGKFVAEMPKEAALALKDAISYAANQILSDVDFAGILASQVILNKAGVPLSLDNRVFKESLKFQVPQTERVYSPTVRRH